MVIDPASEMNDCSALADMLITDYSSSIFDFALLRRPLILLVTTSRRTSGTRGCTSTTGPT